jgi:phosphatidylglycerophosphate synthase
MFSQSDAPRLLVDGRASTADGVDPTETLLGLSLLERMARAARRSGYGRIHLLAAPADAARFRQALADSDIEVSAEPPVPGGARTFYVAGLVVAERGWLEAAVLAPVPVDGYAEFGSGVVICGARASLARFAVMPKGVLDRPEGGAPICIGSRADLAAAERRLVRSLGKSTDGFMERNIERPVSRLLSRRLAKTEVTPNQMTLISAAVGLAAAPFFLSDSALWQTAGALIFLAHSILDGCDGELARLKFQESRWGGVLDYWGDNVVHAAIFACMALGWSRAVGAEWPLALGAAAVLGALGSASFVYWRVMRPKPGAGPLYVSVAKDTKNRLVSLMDSLSRRDFIYLVVALSLFGKAAWFLALAAVGAPIFFIMLLVVAAQERNPRPAHP